MSKWIEFIEIELPPTAQTKRWRVVTKEGHAALGMVRWFGNWQKYCFYTECRAIFEEECLHDIAAFCEEQTRAHRDSGGEKEI